MTTLNVPTSLPAAPVAPAPYHQLAARLSSIGNRFRLAAFLQAAGRASAILLPLALATLFLMDHWTPPIWARITLDILWLLIALTTLALVTRPLFYRPTFAQIARLIERHASDQLPINNALINSVLLAQDLHAGDHNPWLPAALIQLSQQAAPLPLESAVPWKKALNASLLALLIATFSVVLIALAPHSFSHGLAVLLSPSRFVARQGSVKILNVIPGNDTAIAGQPLAFSVTLEAPDHKAVSVQLQLHYASGKTLSYPMQLLGGGGDSIAGANGTSQYTRQGIPATESFDYAIIAGDSSQQFHITVIPQIQLTSLTLDATPPTYTRIALKSFKLNTPSNTSIELPLGSTLHLSGTLDAPIHELLLDIPGKPPVSLNSRDGRTFALDFPLTESLQFTLRANDGSNRTLQQFPAPTDAIPAYAITALPDAPPTVNILQPNGNIELKPDGKLAIIAQAADDYGLSSITLERNAGVSPAGGQDTGVTVETAKLNTRNLTKNFTLDFSKSPQKLGDKLTYRVSVTDNRDLTALNPAWGAQTTTSQSFTITFTNTPNQAGSLADASKLWDQLRQKLTAILDHQIALRKQANGLTPDLSTADAHKLTTTLSDGQKQIRADIAALAKNFPFEPSMKLIQKSLEVLAVEDATDAVDRTADILLLSDNRSLAPLATKLRQHQSRIIDVLQALLAIAEADQQKLARAADVEGGDVPNPTEAWKKLADDLKDFVKEQNAVINATADLAKKPKDEFNTNDDKKLADLASIEDKWERFLSEKLADMSKLAQQDQANASLLEEVVQMKVELATAENALNTKATTIAVPAEESGLEDAQALTTHIERFLSQEPDRKKWEMEDSLTQDNPVMAELPKQLQDQVGDLMDKEEDLTQDMESLAGKFADSIDKGAGWDAADGPISNMSAQGVTGNQMPKDMEIQGRSGEGREGRSSGEMVGSTAEGKEGRQTPTRLTPDAFSNSQVDDKSTLPEGGATGGGKKGNFGTEGLEGPAPQEDPVTQRLQGKQAALRNEAERLALQMNAAHFDNFKLLESNAYLKKSEDALKQFHYQTAMYYQEKAVQSLNTAKVLADGQLHVVTDTTPGANEQLQKDINAALNGPLPKGYADPVKAYFEKLSK